MMQSCASAAKLLGGGPILETGVQHHGLLRVTATSDRHRILTMVCSSGSDSLFCQSAHLTLLAKRHQPEPRRS
jgi:hypothetical protein